MIPLPIIRGTLLNLSILLRISSGQYPHHNPGAAPGEPTRCQAHRVARLVPRRLPAEVDLPCNDAARVADRLVEADRRGTLEVRAHVGVEPRKVQPRNDGGAEQDEIARKIADAWRLTAQENRVSCHDEYSGEKDERPSALPPVRNSCYGEVYYRAKQVTWDREILRLQASVSNVVDDGGQKGRDALKGVS